VHKKTFTKKKKNTRYFLHYFIT